MEQAGRGVGGLHSFASNSSLDSLECTQLSADGDLGASHIEPNIKKWVLYPLLFTVLLGKGMVGREGDEVTAQRGDGETVVFFVLFFNRNAYEGKRRLFWVLIESDIGYLKFLDFKAI